MWALCKILTFLVATVNGETRDPEKWSNLPNPHNKLVTESGLEPRFPFQVSVHSVTVYCGEPRFTRGENSNNESFIIFSLMRPDRVHLFFSASKLGWPPSCYCFSLEPRLGLALAFVLFPVFAVPRRMGRERIQAGHGGTDVSWSFRGSWMPWPGVSFRAFQVLGGGRCL